MTTTAEGLNGAVDKLIDATQSGNERQFKEAAASTALAANSLFGLLSESKVFTAIGGLGGANDLMKAANDLYAAGNVVDAMRALADALSAVGSLMAAVPTPHTRAVGTGLAVGFTVVKRALDLYKAGDGNPVPTAPRPIAPPLLPDFEERLEKDAENYTYKPRRKFEQTCRNPNFPTSSPPTYRVVYLDPLAIDLDGDGLETVGVDGAYPVVFDHDGDRIKTGTGWVAADDAWLVRDLNGDGQIDSGAEMFGDQTLLANGTKGSSGMVALKGLDSNADGKIDAGDAAFFTLKIWQDSNQNGVSEAGELKTLAEAGLAQISLSSSTPTFTTSVNVAGGMYMANQVMTVTRADGTTTSAYDLSAKHDGFHSEFMDAVEVPVELQGLPNLAGKCSIGCDNKRINCI